MQAEAQFGIQPAGCFSNLLTAACCACCSAVQVHREVTARRQIAQIQAPQQILMVAQPGVQLQY